MGFETESYVPKIELPDVKDERLKIKNYGLLGVFTTSLERARVSDEPDENDFIEAMKSDDEPNLVDGQVITQSDNLLLHLDVPPRENEHSGNFIADLGRSVDMVTGYCQAFPRLRYVYGTSYLASFRYASKLGFLTQELPADSLKAQVSLELYREAKGEEKAKEAPTPKLAYITPESLLEHTGTVRSIEDEANRSLGILTVTHQRLSRKEKTLEQTTPEEMKNYCVGNVLRIEIGDGDEKSLKRSLDMLVGYIKAFPSIQDVYIINPDEFTPFLEEIGFGRLDSEDCPVFDGQEQMLEQGGIIGTSRYDLLEFGVKSSDTVRPVDRRRMVT